MLQVDWYPEEGSFTTSAMAEGAIEGDAAMYEVPSPFSTAFTFSRFHTEPRVDLPAVQLATSAAEATTVA